MSLTGQCKSLLIRPLLHPSIPHFDPIPARFFAQVLPKLLPYTQHGRRTTNGQALSHAFCCYLRVFSFSELPSACQQSQQPTGCTQRSIIPLHLYSIQAILCTLVDIEVTTDFEHWWDSLDESEREDVRAVVGLLEERGPTLPFPYSTGVASSKHHRMRELRIQHQGRPYRILYAFDPRRTGILLIGGDKTGNNRWYEEYVPIADRLYDEHL